MPARGSLRYETPKGQAQRPAPTNCLWVNQKDQRKAMDKACTVFLYGRGRLLYVEIFEFPLRGCVSLPYYGILKSGGNSSYFGGVYVRHLLRNHIAP
jgi:hypothetical protein